jgi:phosphate uptake regulator
VSLIFRAADRIQDALTGALTGVGIWPPIYHVCSPEKRSSPYIVNKLIGPEILEETVNKVVILDLLSSEELQVERAVRRMRTVVKSMIQDSISALVRNNRRLAADVMQRDDDVDRLNLLISRQFTEILRSRSVRQKALNVMSGGYGGTETLLKLSMTGSLERVLDYTVNIAEQSINLSHAHTHSK